MSSLPPSSSLGFFFSPLSLSLFPSQKNSQHFYPHSFFLFSNPRAPPSQGGGAKPLARREREGECSSLLRKAEKWKERSKARSRPLFLLSLKNNEKNHTPSRKRGCVQARRQFAPYKHKGPGSVFISPMSLSLSLSSLPLSLC